MSQRVWVAYMLNRVRYLVGMLKRVRDDPSYERLAVHTRCCNLLRKFDAIEAVLKEHTREAPCRATTVHRMLEEFRITTPQMLHATMPIRDRVARRGIRKAMDEMLHATCERLALEASMALVPLE